MALGVQYITESSLRNPKSNFCQNDKQIPIYSIVTSGYPLSDLVTILLKSDLDHEKVCTMQPLSVTDNVSFVIDVHAVDFHDLKANDLGSWSTTGTKKSFLTFSNSVSQINNPVWCVPSQSGCN